MALPRILVTLLSLLPTPLRRRLILWMLRRIMAPRPARRARLARRPADLLQTAASAARAARGVLQTLGAQATDALAVAAQSARMWVTAIAMGVSADLAALTRALPSRVSVAPAPDQEQKEIATRLRTAPVMRLVQRLERLLPESPWLGAPPSRARFGGPPAPSP